MWCQPEGAVGWRLLDGNNGRELSAWARRSNAAASRRRLSFVINCHRVWRRPKTSRADLRPLHPITITRDAAPALPALSDDRIFHDLHQVQPSWKETIRDMPNTQVYLTHLPTCPFAPCPFDLTGSRWTAAGPPRHVVVLCRRGMTAKIWNFRPLKVDGVRADT